VAGQHTHQYITHLEVLRIHMQLVTVQFTKLSKGTVEVVQILQAINKGVHYLLAMGLHLAVAHNSIRRGQVPKGVKEPLNQPSQGLTTNNIHLHLALKAGNSSLLLSTQMHHGVCFRLLLATLQAREAGEKETQQCLDHSLCLYLSTIFFTNCRKQVKA
uniref:Uncharacterized protein n=1 Tax=Neovison vison TaxID=452646 RepID=A0A8C7A801_NEOVI